MLKFGLIFCLGIGTVLCDGGRGGGRHQRRGGRTLDTGYSAPDGGIFTSGFHTDNANFGNQYSAQNVQPSYGQPQYGSGSRGAQPQYGNGGGGGQAQYGGGGQQAQYGGNGGRASQPQYGGGGDDNIAMLEKAVPGVPGQDYPIYAEVPDTVFSCDGQVDGGYYADPEAECQVFHICTNDGQGGLSKYSFLCPNGTIFNQEYFICDWWFNFDCSEAEGLYSLNEDIAAEREAATQALLNAAASNGQPTYVSSSSTSNSYSAPSQASSGGYNAPAGGGGRRQNGGGRRKNNGKRKNNGGRKKAAASNGYSAPSSSANAGYGAPANNNYGAPTSQAASAYGAPANNNYGAPANNNYGAPANNNYGAPDYDDLPSYGKRK